MISIAQHSQLRLLLSLIPVSKRVSCFNAQWWGFRQRLLSISRETFSQGESVCLWHQMKSNESQDKVLKALSLLELPFNVFVFQLSYPSSRGEIKTPKNDLIRHSTLERADDKYTGEKECDGDIRRIVVLSGRTTLINIFTHKKAFTLNSIRKVHCFNRKRKCNSNDGTMQASFWGTWCVIRRWRKIHT